MSRDHVIHEAISSRRTTALFLGLTLAFLILSTWRTLVSGIDGWAIVFICFFAFFLFYAINYRTLHIRMTAESLQLQFGIFKWKIPMTYIEDCFQDRTSLWRIGGAGIHFSPIGGRYRAMFNFLEHPRVVIALKVRRGPVGAIAFSTRQPERVLQFIKEAVQKYQHEEPLYGIARISSK